MKLKQLFEVQSTSDMEDHLIDLSKFGDRQFFVSENGSDIFKRVSTDHPDHWLLDINEQAFVFGVAGDQYKGQIRNKIFVTRRGWTSPESRGKGLVTTIMYALYNQLDYAIMCDDVISPSGMAVWKKLCSTLKITHCYVVNKGVVQEISQEQMTNNLNSNVDNNQYIIEQVISQQLLEVLGSRHLITPAGFFKKYDFSGVP